MSSVKVHLAKQHRVTEEPYQATSQSKLESQDEAEHKKKKIPYSNRTSGNQAIYLPTPQQAAQETNQALVALILWYLI